ncbi:MAG: hypothetical protein K6A94_13085, partial [Bacteroidales bacterium]|nr:hypothetical protein [Bacteroidales bacterium]
MIMSFVCYKSQAAKRASLLHHLPDHHKALFIGNAKGVDSLRSSTHLRPAKDSVDNDYSKQRKDTKHDAEERPPMTGSFIFVRKHR